MEFNSLEAKVAQFVGLCERLRAENRRPEATARHRPQRCQAPERAHRRREGEARAAAAAPARLSRPARAMADSAKTIEVNILGRSYRVACEEGEREALLQAVAYLDTKMGEIKKAGKVNGADRIAVMAALNIAHELLSTRLGSGFDIGQAKRRIASIEAKLDAALAQQEKLF
jgi:cell division protein ZapA